MCNHFCFYLRGAQSTLRTDHRSLWWLQKFRNSDSILARWYIHRSLTFGPPLSREGPFVAASPHPRIGNDMGCCTGSQPTWILILLFTMDTLYYHFTTHDSWSGWGHSNLPAYWDGIPANGSGLCPSGKPSSLHDNCNMTPV